MDAATAAVHAYISDTVEPAQRYVHFTVLPIQFGLTQHIRARIFSLNLGILFTGMAVGPTIGAMLVRHTGNPLSVFYFATALHVFYACINWTILPESLSPVQMHAARRKRVEAREHETVNSREVTFARRLGRRLFSFAAPLAQFLPRRSENLSTLGKATRSDWSLTLLGIAYLLTTSTFGTYSYKFQYTAAQFGWTSEQVTTVNNSCSCIVN
jgi:MFS family permease